MVQDQFIEFLDNNKINLFLNLDYKIQKFKKFNYFAI